MKTHTPGPWTYEKQMISGPSLAGATTLFAHGDVIGRIYQSGDRDGNAQANAQLAAAAPDLLEALRGVLRVADRATQEFDAARAAIAKAVRS